MLYEPECELNELSELNAYLIDTQIKTNGWLNNGSKGADILTPVTVPFYVTRDFLNVVI